MFVIVFVSNSVLAVKLYNCNIIPELLFSLKPSIFKLKPDAALSGFNEKFVTTVGTVI